MMQPHRLYSPTLNQCLPPPLQPSPHLTISSPEDFTSWHSSSPTGSKCKDAHCNIAHNKGGALYTNRTWVVGGRYTLQMGVAAALFGGVERHTAMRAVGAISIT